MNRRLPRYFILIAALVGVIGSALPSHAQDDTAKVILWDREKAAEARLGGEIKLRGDSRYGIVGVVVTAAMERKILHNQRLTRDERIYLYDSLSVSLAVTHALPTNPCAQPGWSGEDMPPQICDAATRMVLRLRDEEIKVMLRKAGY